MEANMAEKGAIEQLEKQDLASELGKQNLGQDRTEEKADAKLAQDSTDALEALEIDLLDRDYEHAYYDSAEDADDEVDTDDDFEEVIHPLNIKKAETGKGSDQVHLSTKHSEQTTQTTAHTHGRVKWVDNLAQAQNNSTEASHTAPATSEHRLSRAPTPYHEPLSVNQISELLHPSPPLRRRKGSMALRKKASDSATAHGMMSQAGGNQGSLYGHNQDHTGDKSQNCDTHLPSTHRGKMPEARSNQNVFSSDDQGKESSTSSENPVLKHKTSGFPKADAVLGYGEKDSITPKKSMTDLVTPPKASHEKKSFRKLFHRKASKESTTPPSSSGKTAGRITISAPTLIDASPNAKNVVNYSRPIVPQSSSDVFNGSPVVRGRSSSALHSTAPFSGPGTSPGGLTGRSGSIPVGLNISLIREHSDAIAVRGSQAADEHGAISENLAAEREPDAGDRELFNPSDYSGDENSVQQAVAMPIVYSARAKRVNVHPPHGPNARASGNGSGAGGAITPGTENPTYQDAMTLGAQDADRYYVNAMTSQTRPTTTNADDPFIDPAFQNLLAKPANDVAAKEMARIKAAREAKNMGGGLMERMHALLAKSEAKPGTGSTGNATVAVNPRTNPDESLLSKMRGLGKKSKKGKEREDSEEEIIHKVEAEKERGLREEKKIHAAIKAKLAAKDAANGSVRGAGIPRIDYGPPSLRTALGGCAPTDEERDHASAIENRRAAELVGGRVQKDGDNTTVRGQFEGY